MVENEVRILRKLSHPNIMSLIDEQDTKAMLYLVCELVKGKCNHIKSNTDINSKNLNNFRW